MPCVLINHEGRTAIELNRGPKLVHLIRFQPSNMRIAKEPHAAIDNEFKKADICLQHAAVSYLSCFNQITDSALGALVGIVKEGQTEEQRMKTIDVKKAATNELLSFYNANSGTAPVKRFADRKTAERRVEALMMSAAKPAKPSAMADTAKQIIKADKKPASPKTSHSASVKSSWKDKDVATRRSTKHHVSVNGKDYRSVLEAFKVLKLPVSKHIKFRAELKEAGAATFDGHRFKLVV